MKAMTTSILGGDEDRWSVMGRARRPSSRSSSPTAPDLTPRIAETRGRRCAGCTHGRGSRSRCDVASTGWTSRLHDPDRPARGRRHDARGTSTTMVAVHARGGGQTGSAGPTRPAPPRASSGRAWRTSSAAVTPSTSPAAWSAMQRQLRNVGRPGIASCALSAVDVALWDLAARLLDVPLRPAAGARRDDVPVYGSGGFTSYDDDTLRRQLRGWVEDAGHPAGEDQDRRVVGQLRGPRPRPRGGRARRRRRRRRAVRRRQRRLHRRSGGPDGPRATTTSA